MHPADLFSDGVTDVLDRARSWAGAPRVGKRGRIIWKKCVTHIERELAVEIARRARVFFKDVYAIPGVDRKSLNKEEKDFWARCNKLMRLTIGPRRIRKRRKRCASRLGEACQV